jgi:dolichol-phosphate mannosyltransferase
VHHPSYFKALEPNNSMVSLLKKKSPIHAPVPPLESRSVTVVIPALNEEGNLERLLQSIAQAFGSLGFILPVLVVDDGSTDNSPQILKKLDSQYPFLTVIRHPLRRGVTGVWKTALSHVKSDWIFWGQADLESDPLTDLPLLLESCTHGVDGVAGWRQKRGDGKVLASRLANFACRTVFGLTIHDMNWIKLVRRDLLMPMPLDQITHRYLLAVLAAYGCNITEVPTPWHPRHSGTSKFGRKRLISSALDFMRFCRWFFIENRRLFPLNYISAIRSALTVGFQAGREAFRRRLENINLPKFQQTMKPEMASDT